MEEKRIGRRSDHAAALNTENIYSGALEVNWKQNKKLNEPETRDEEGELREWRLFSDAKVGSDLPTTGKHGCKIWKHDLVGLLLFTRDIRRRVAAWLGTKKPQKLEPRVLTHECWIELTTMIQALP